MFQRSPARHHSAASTLLRRRRIALLMPLALALILVWGRLPAPAAAQFYPAPLRITVVATPGTVQAGQGVTIGYSVLDPNPGQAIKGAIFIDFGDGTSQQVPPSPTSGTTVHIYLNPGIYTVTVSAANIGMISGQGTTTVAVGKGALPAPAPVVTGCSWTGLWDTGTYGQVNMVQSGSTITGTYSFYPSPGAALVQGQVTGTAIGTTLSGTWAQGPTYVGQDAGSFSFTMAPGCNLFNGQWRASTTPAALWDGAWNGTRIG